MLYSDRINFAIKMATKAHDGQFRRGIEIPYIIHPFAVALITQKYIEDEDVFIAALLHDVVEDVPNRIYSTGDILKDFGPNVLRLVLNVTEPRIENVSRDEAWQYAKDSYIRHLSQINDKKSLIISLADKLHNMTELINLSETKGKDIWSYFYASREKEIWFVETVFEVLKTKNLPEEAISEYSRILEKLKTL